MIQSCDVYINIFCDETEKKTISTWLKSYFKEKENRSIWQVPTDYIDVIDDAKGLIVLDVEIDVPCIYIGGYPGSMWEPPEPAYISSYFDEIDFLDWIKEILPDRYDVEVEIDSDSTIPTEEELIEDFEMEADYAEQ